MVELRVIPGWEDYRAGNDGVIYSLRRRKRMRPLKPSPGGSGYLQVVLCRDGEQKTQRVHVLVTEAFHGPRPEGLEASHQNGDHLDNRPENLRWETRSENLGRREQHGTHDKGLANSRASMTPELLARVQELLAANQTNAAIALQVGVSKTTISRIRSGRRYVNV